MKVKKKRHVDIELYPQTHLKGILKMRANERPARAMKKRFGNALRTFGAAVIFPLLKGKSLIRRGLKSTRVRLHAEQEETIQSQSLPYYEPKINAMGYAGGQVVMSMEHTIAPSDELLRQRRKNAARKRTSNDKRTITKRLSHEASVVNVESDGTAALWMEQALPSPGAIPQRQDRTKTKDDSKKRRTKNKTKTARASAGKRTVKWKNIAIALACCAFFGLFGWYMLEGRFCVVNVFDDGSLQSVRTKEATVEAMFAEAGIGLTAEDLVSVALGEKPQEGMVLSIQRARDVDITIEGQNMSVRLAQGTVEDALALAGITCYENDAVIPALDTPVRTNMDVQVYRAKTLHIKTKNKTMEVQMGLGTVGDALTKAGITYDDGDEISPSTGTAIEDGMEISFMSVDIKTVTHTETIKYDTVRKNSSKYYYGTTRVSQTGKNGTRTIVEEVTYEDGKEVSRKKISNKVTKEPVDKIILVGTKATSNHAIEDLPAGGPPESMIAYSVTMTQITAYTHTGYRTASGKWPTVGMCAIDRRVFLYGTVFYIPGYGYAVAEDTGSGVGDPYSMDVFMDTKADCLRWGRKRNKVVYVLK